jgi:hypothetical protein
MRGTPLIPLSVEQTSGLQSWPGADSGESVFLIRLRVALVRDSSVNPVYNKTYIKK